MAAITPTSLTPLLFTAFIGWVYFRRIRRQFGRQPYQPRRAALRLALLSLVLCGLLVAAVVLPHVALGVAVGILAGGALGALAVWHVQVESTDGARWYTPNPWIGGVLSLLLVGRLAWRYTHGALAAGAAGGAAMGQNASPLTLGIAAALVAFYLVNGAGLAWRMKQLPVATPRTPAAAGE